MDDYERQQIRSANAGLHAALDAFHDEYDREMSQLGEINRKLAALKVHATSPNSLARVTVDASGTVTDITIADDAFRRSSPKLLSEDLNAAIRGGMEAAAQAREQVLAPIKTVVDGMADLNEVVPGAPGLRELRARLSERESEDR
ncbi:YbaB/EbfC family nucleoid-associated protein [Nocardia blacklockiae]|uniref:YbaB/EbfC family nucleoid-associated protein n=1 Tax=Nocardia blacklockiae TaxID=480036 RepID=UPI0018936132|nr:YbaB/EbfC family nucleoid-associated protein [Nocardia blacklockiae]MBF6171346.1 YbaB/EbfC family nucleoid-associated protein [Nocardia blacklockiae]